MISLLSSGYAHAAPIYSHKVVATYPHSTDSYTEGSSVSIKYFTRVSASMDALL
jgi:hypothetical protein